MIEWLAVLPALLVAAFFAAAETAVPLANRARLRQLAGTVGGEQTVLDLLEALPRTLAVARLGGLLAMVAAASLTAGACLRLWPGNGLWIGAALVLALLTFALRSGAKRIARRDAERAALAMGATLRLASLVLGPALSLAASGSGALLALLGVRRERGEPMAVAPVLEQLGATLAVPLAEGALPGGMLQQVLDFGETTIEEVMVPRTEVVGVEVGAPVREAVAVIRQHRFSRLPVYREDLDHIAGVVHQFDLFRARGPEQPVEELMRPIQFVPESKKCDDLLREMQHSGQGMAVVLDEYGGTAGIVTAEDLLERLVGGLREEEAQRVTLRRVDDDTLVADAWIRVDEVNAALGVEIPEGDYETLGGYVLELLGHIPHRGEIVAGPGFRVEVVAADRRRIRTLRVEKVRPAAEHEAEDAR